MKKLISFPLAALALTLSAAVPFGCGKSEPADAPPSDHTRADPAPQKPSPADTTTGSSGRGCVPATWKRQRRIIDPAFEGGRLRDTFPAMWDAGVAAVERLEQTYREQLAEERSR